MNLSKLLPFFGYGCLSLVIVGTTCALEIKSIDVSSFPSLQAAIDANPGRMIQVPAGDYEISSALRISQPDTGLFGPAKIIQTNPREPIVIIENAKGARMENLVLARPASQPLAYDHGLVVRTSSDVDLRRLRVEENHSRASIMVLGSNDVSVEDCTILNYKGVTIDDRTASPELYGYSFNVIDGTGIQVRDTRRMVIRNNRIQDHELVPTKELRDKYSLGDLVVVPEKPGRLMPAEIFRAKYASNWLQGAAIQVSGPTVSEQFIVTGNLIDNAGQGIDLHCDNAIIAHNLINNAMIGLKAMHGAKHVLIDSNQFTRVDLWGILLMPGQLSRSYDSAPGAKGVTGENIDGGTIISNNIFSRFGYGDQYWAWVNSNYGYPDHNVIAVLFGQVEENPPIRDVLISGNVVYDSGRDGIQADGKWQTQPPRYRYAIYVEQTRKPLPANVRVQGNVLNPGSDGEMNFTPEP